MTDDRAQSAEEIVRGLRNAADKYRGFAYGANERLFSLVIDRAITAIELLLGRLTASQQETRAAVEALESIKRDANEPDKVYIHLSHYFGRGHQEAGEESR